MKVKFISIAIGIFALFVVASGVASIYNQYDDSGELDLVGAAFVGALLLIGGVIALQNRQIKKKRNYLDQLREEQPVAYFFTYELADKVNLISATPEEITLWSIKSKKLAPDVVILQKDVHLAKGKVKVALLRSVVGLTITSRTDTKSVLRLNICKDVINLLFPARKDAELDEAIRRLASGK